MFRKERIRREVLTRSSTPLLILVLSVSATCEVTATDWAKAMFDHTTHDFGMVPRGSEAEHRFTIENIYLEDAHIKSVSSTCQCTSVKVTEPSLKTHEKSQVIATLNTRQFTGSKDATIRVVFDKPFPAEVQLHVRSYIRTDVVLEPGSVRFGEVTEGKEVTRLIDLRHAGSPDWKITGCENEDPNVSVAIKPISSDAAQTAYQLAFTLKATAPAGYIRRHVALLTNDQNPNAQRVLVLLEGVVTPAVSVRPSPLNFRLVPVGREATARIVVQGQQDLQILEVVGPDARFALAPSAKLKESSRIHVLPVIFRAGAKPGKIEGQILIQTDIGGGRTLRLDVVGEVVDISSSTLPGVSPSTAPSPVGDESVPATEEPTPPAEEPVSAEEPAPAVEESVPAAEEPAPVEKRESGVWRPRA